jgi:hypothetical protein
MGRNGEEWGGGRSVYEQPGAKVDGIALRKRRDSKYVGGDKWETDREASRGAKRGIVP